MPLVEPTPENLARIAAFDNLTQLAPPIRQPMKTEVRGTRMPLQLLGYVLDPEFAERMDCNNVISPTEDFDELYPAKPSPQQLERIGKALEICADCGVKLACQANGMEAARRKIEENAKIAPFGIRGGMTESAIYQMIEDIRTKRQQKQEAQDTPGSNRGY